MPTETKIEENKERFGEKILRLIRKMRWQIVSIFSKAPDIEGINPIWQERNLPALIRLRVKKALGQPLTFQEQKKLMLSEKDNFAKNPSSFGPKEIALDEDVFPLVAVVNEKPYLVSTGSCSGHLHEFSGVEGSEEFEFDGHGFLVFRVDKKAARSENLLSELQEFCAIESDKDSECYYKLEKLSHTEYDDIYALTWDWNHELYRQEDLLRTQLDNAMLKGDEIEEMKIREALRRLKEEQRKVAYLAKEKDIPKRYRAFIERISEFIRNFS